jgi:hypothetical protein
VAAYPIGRRAASSIGHCRVTGVCHEHERELVVLYQRWEQASRSRLAGAGFKLPSAAAFKRRGGERLRKRRPRGRQVRVEEMSESKLSDEASLTR